MIIVVNKNLQENWSATEIIQTWMGNKVIFVHFIYYSWNTECYRLMFQMYTRCVLFMSMLVVFVVSLSQFFSVGCMYTWDWYVLSLWIPIYSIDIHVQYSYIIDMILKMCLKAFNYRILWLRLLLLVVKISEA